ncbi:uncharacterized protein LOC132313089 [Cornus florida]|uniref:uncharacterized protein LOC132313089 n=1 Tax=Cornus florida TaxID=4283 RepID=UPI0028A109DB|nr:uncharacterized protein LOC132313089 [Cornus florida]
MGTLNLAWIWKNSDIESSNGSVVSLSADTAFDEVHWAAELPSSAAMASASGSEGPQKEQNVMLPPKRGQIKIKIFNGFVKTVSNVVEKATAVGKEKMKKQREVRAEEAPHPQSLSKG